MLRNEAEQDLTPTVAAVNSVTVNPAPLGLCGFALTTFVLSAANAGLFTGESIVIGLALFYGGLAQLLAGMWEFKVGNTFGATAFTSYGAFWLAVGGSLQFHWIAPGQGFGFFLLGWTIFTLMLFLCTLRLSVGLMTLFGLLFVTFALLTVHALGGPPVTAVLGGYLGILTALVAWYNALAGLLVATNAGYTLPTGPRS